MNQIVDFFKNLFDSSDWPPRWHCGKWSEFHGWLYIISDLAIWSAYFTIPIVIIRYISRKRNILFTKLYFLFAAFILACGATHFLDAVAFWLPVYRLSALVRFITGVVSWVTVFYLVKYLPVIFSMRSQSALEAEITERKKAEDALDKLNKELEQRVREQTETVVKTLKEKNNILESIGDGFFALDKNWIVTYWNRVAEQNLAVKKDDIIGKSLWEIFPGSEDTLSYRNHYHAMETKQVMHFEDYYPALKIWHEINSYPSENGLSIFFKDITERKESEKRIKESEERFKALIENNRGIISLTDESLNSIYRSPSSTRITGWTQNEMILIGGRHWTHPDDRIIMQTVVAEAIKKPGLPQSYLSRYLHKNGHYIWLEGTVTKMPDESTVKGIVFNANDVTERIELEQLLAKANTLARIGSWEVDLLKGTVYWNDMTREIHEAESSFVPDLATGINFYKEGLSRDLITQKVNEAIELGKPWDVELQIVTAKNNERWIRSIGETEFEDGKCVRVYGSFQYINERKKGEEERKQLTERLLLATQSVQLGIWDWDIKSNTLVWDEGMYRLYNLTENEFTSVYEGWASRVHPNDRQRVDNDIQLALEGKKKYHPEFRIFWPDSSVHYIKASGIVERDNNGNAVRMTGFNWDVTERKLAEIKLIDLNEDLQKHTKELSISNAELEQFAFVASHDLQEPLRMVTSFLTQLEKKYSNLLDERGKKYIDFAVDGAKRMRQLILDLLEYSRVGRIEYSKEDCELDTIVAEIKTLYRKQIEEKNAIISHSPLPVIKCYKVPVRQVFQNIIENALKYTAEDRACKITIDSIELPTHWQFNITDNGIGIEEEFFNKIFIIFQRLHNHDAYSGTGMGLAVTKKIIESLGGKIWLTSEQGKGSTFSFTLLKNSI